MILMCRILLLVSCLVAAAVAQASPCAVPLAEEPRLVLGLYDSREEPNPDETRLHRFVEFPLNHLGFMVRYVDVARDPLPSLDAADLAGVISWFRRPLADPHAFAAWAGNARPGCPQTLSLIVLGETGLLPDKRPDAAEAQYLERLGLRWASKSLLLGDFTQVAQIDSGLLGRETDFIFRPGRYAALQALSPQETALRLAPARKADGAGIDLVVLHPPNAYVQDSATLDTDGRSGRQFWIVDPIAVLRHSLSRGPHPVADVTTLNGRRIYFETVGPEGWLAPAPIRTFDEEPRLGAENLRDTLLAPFPDVPATVAVVTGDIDPDIGGKPAEAGLRLATSILSSPQIAAATAGRSLVRYWALVDQSSAVEGGSDAAQAPLPGDQTNQLLTVLGRNLREAFADPQAPAEPQLSDGLRQYAQDAFDLSAEITAPLRKVESLAGEKPQAPLFLWVGDGRPDASALSVAAEAPSMGGGPAILNPQPVLSDLAPFGRQVGGILQVYNALPGDLADTGYPAGKDEDLHALSLLVDQTEHPTRLKPLHLAYSAGAANQFGTRSAVARVKRQVAMGELLPIFAAQYVGIVQGFSTVRFVPDGPGRWRVLQRGALQTIRFDGAGALSVDMGQSRGVLGARRTNDALYIALNPAEAEPLILVVTKPSATGMLVPAGRVGLVQTNLVLSSLPASGCTTTLAATGWGRGRLALQGDPGAQFHLRVNAGPPEAQGKLLAEGQLVADASGLVTARVPTARGEPQTLTLQQQCGE